MAPHDDLNQHIAPGSSIDARLAQPRHARGLAVVDSRGDIDGIPFLHGYISGSMAVDALVLDDLAAALAVRTGLHVPDRPEQGLLGEHHLALAAALRAGLRAGPGLGTGTVTGLTGLLHIQLYLFLTAEHSFLKGNTDAGAQVRPLHGAVAAAPAPAAAEQIAEDIPEDIAEIRPAEIEASSARSAFKSGMPELIVLPPLVRIAQHGIGFRSLLEFLFRLRVTRIHVRMVLLRQNAICFFDCSVICTFIYAQDFIIVPLLLRHSKHLILRNTYCNSLSHFAARFNPYRKKPEQTARNRTAENLSQHSTKPLT